MHINIHPIKVSSTNSQEHQLDKARMRRRSMSIKNLMQGCRISEIRDLQRVPRTVDLLNNTESSRTFCNFIPAAQREQTLHMSPMALMSNRRPHKSQRLAVCEAWNQRNNNKVLDTKYVSASALCAEGVTGLSSLLSEFCSPTLAYILLGPPPNPDGHEISDPVPPVGRLPKSWFLLSVLANTYCSAVWIHYIIHTNLIFAPRPTCDSLFHFPAKVSYSAVPSKTLQNAKPKLLNNEKDYPQNCSTWASKFTSEIAFSASCFHWHLKMQ